MDKKDQLYKQMSMDSNSGLNFEQLKKLKVEEYIEFQYNRQIELLNKYTENKIQEIVNHKEKLKRELIEQQRNQEN
ncbi:hypothetical protein DDB_G0291165 [Dictyostelium discoideum AX4]|uniref:Uncharacterized protein n=1 Tax=Dictyostelium discoideum TaxID=44689 RepID=Q54F19_DICDI|nr:hypothetical protein DDB_G0291165 [Dictyostelium discoideum AX4]EAL61866.1 hypothetical protein DDB_G0291165 [Dictyostelium discoideum AX4]|eukprot:XP_635371.1 hypothetical protein DDB_G0291165 [Dictyostelium discoideum AX4]